MEDNETNKTGRTQRRQLQLYPDDGPNNRISLIYRPPGVQRTSTSALFYPPNTTRHFTPEEWTNPKILSEAIINAVKHPLTVPVNVRTD